MDVKAPPAVAARIESTNERGAPSTQKERTAEREAQEAPKQPLRPLDEAQPPAARQAQAEAPPKKKRARFWSPPGDTYEQHEPPRLKATRAVDRVLDKVAPIRTHERVMTEVGGSFFGAQVGITISQLELVQKGTRGVEWVQVVNRDGSSNVETILARKFFSKNTRLELQGPALNSSVTPGEAPLGARFVGVGFTSDGTSAMDHDAVSYTVEVKITERSVLELAALGGPGAAAAAASALATGSSAVASTIADFILGAVPVLSTALALCSARRAVHVFKDKTASKEMKVFAVLHALGDAVRCVLPLAGTLINAGLVGVAAMAGWLHVRYAEHAPPTGPPGAGAAPPSNTPPPSRPSPPEAAPPSDEPGDPRPPR